MSKQLSVPGTDMEEVVAKSLEGLEREPKFGHNMLKHFYFDKEWINLNHGSTGTYPRSVGKVADIFRVAAERQPDVFQRYAFLKLLTSSRQALANLVKVPRPELVLVNNATSGINIVLRSLAPTFSSKDHILYFDFIYGACGKTVLYACETSAAQPLRVPATLPMSDDEIIKRFRTAVEETRKSGGEVKAAVFDTICSMPGIRLPFEKFVAACKELNVLSIIDGAHAAGVLPLDLGKLDADFFTSNCHKWLFVPRGCALLHVPARNQKLIRSTLPTSWGWNPLPDAANKHKQPASPFASTEGESEFAAMFDMQATQDVSPYFAIPAAIAFREKVCGGEEAIMQYTEHITQTGAKIIAEKLGSALMESPAGPCTLQMIKLPLTVKDAGIKEGEEGKITAWLGLNMALSNTFIPPMFYDGSWWVRVAGNVYLEESDFVKGADTLKTLLKKIADGEHLKDL